MTLAVAARHLLRSQSSGVLATQSQKWPGYPYPSALPYACDATGAPLLLMSRLAEHTRNGLACPQVGFLISSTTDDVWEAARLTLLGELLPDPDPVGAARFLRYHPQAARYLELPDFGFYRLQVSHARHIAGFGAMGWLESASLLCSPPWPATEESRLLDWVAELAHAELCQKAGTHCSLAGVDAEGLDLHTASGCVRRPFGQTLRTTDELPQALSSLLEEWV